MGVLVPAVLTWSSLGQKPPEEERTSRATGDLCSGLFSSFFSPPFFLFYVLFFETFALFPGGMGEWGVFLFASLTSWS